MKSAIDQHLARLAANFPTEPDRCTSEGLLSWKALNWVCDLCNPSIVSNIPHFLPGMLTDLHPLEYRCSYQEELLQVVVTAALPPDVQGR